ncbi:thiol-disulfide oxidoreductase ResA [bacterium BMS3Abin05]|nr:thiol-disulfide oxidoreductase ResA [bacterium BMS3Abin05]GBE28124.1 thiol-disulfide oxidoreductase ResA [bacterium BMS3Bbin03]HDK35639.1 TlpA family protein disulfide reductase [Bacteroidota bacterium]
MKILRNPSILLLAGILVFVLETCSKSKTEASGNTPVKTENTVVAKKPAQMNALMNTLGIQRFQKTIIAPDFELKNLDGKLVSLKDYRGKFVLLNFMATWCHWCRKEMPHLQKLHDQFKDKDFVIIAVFSDREGVKVVKPFIKKSGYTFTNNSGTYNSALLDPTGRVTSMYRVTGTPTTYFIDKNGKTIGAAIGYRDWSQKDAIDLIGNFINAK